MVGLQSGEMPIMKPELSQLKKYSLSEIEPSLKGHSYAKNSENIGKTGGWKQLECVIVKPDNVGSAWYPDFHAGQIPIKVDKLGGDWLVDKGDAVVKKLGEDTVETDKSGTFNTRKSGILSVEELKKAGYIWIEAPEGKEIAITTKGESPVFFCRVDQSLDQNGKVGKSTMSFEKK